MGPYMTANIELKLDKNPYYDSNERFTFDQFWSESSRIFLHNSTPVSKEYLIESKLRFDRPWARFVAVRLMGVDSSSLKWIFQNPKIPKNLLLKSSSKILSRNLFQGGFKKNSVNKHFDWLKLSTNQKLKIFNEAKVLENIRLEAETDFYLIAMVRFF